MEPPYAPPMPMMIPNAAMPAPEMSALLASDPAAMATFQQYFTLFSAAQQAVSSAMAAGTPLPPNDPNVMITDALAKGEMPFLGNMMLMDPMSVPAVAYPSPAPLEWNEAILQQQQQQPPPPPLQRQKQQQQSRPPRPPPKPTPPPPPPPAPAPVVVAAPAHRSQPTSTAAKQMMHIPVTTYNPTKGEFPACSYVPPRRPVGRPPKNNTQESDNNHSSASTPEYTSRSTSVAAQPVFKRSASNSNRAAVAIASSLSSHDSEDDNSVDDDARRWSLEEEFAIIEGHAKYGTDWEAILKTLPNPSKYTPRQIASRWDELNERNSSAPRSRRAPSSKYKNFVPTDEVVSNRTKKNKAKRPAAAAVAASPSPVMDSFFESQMPQAKRFKRGSAVVLNDSDLSSSESGNFVYSYPGPIGSTIPNPYRRRTEQKRNSYPAWKNFWTPEEDEALRVAVAQFGSDWVKISQQLPMRTPSDCSSRWWRHANPNLNKGVFTTQEDDAIMALQEVLGNKWQEIAERMGTNRSGLDVQRRFKVLHRGNYRPATSSVRPDTSDLDQFGMISDSDSETPPQHTQTAVQTAKRGRGRPRKIASPPEETAAAAAAGVPSEPSSPSYHAADSDDEIDHLIDEKIEQAVVGEAPVLPLDGIIPEFTPFACMDASEIRDLEQMKEKYEEICENYSKLATQHSDLIQLATRLRTREANLLSTISGLQRSVRTLQAIKYVDLGGLQIKMFATGNNNSKKEPSAEQNDLEIQL